MEIKQFLQMSVVGTSKTCDCLCKSAIACTQVLRNAKLVFLILRSMTILSSFQKLSCYWFSSQNLRERLNFHKGYEKFYAVGISCVPYISLTKSILNQIWLNVYVKAHLHLVYNKKGHSEKPFSTCEAPFTGFNSVKNKHELRRYCLMFLCFHSYFFFFFF